MIQNWFVLSIVNNKIKKLKNLQKITQFRSQLKKTPYLNILNSQLTFSTNKFSNFSQRQSSNTQKKLLTSTYNESAIKIMQSIENHIQSIQFKPKFNSYHYIQKYSWICIHTWLILNRLKSTQNITNLIHSFFLKRKIQSLLQEYIKDHVYQYDEYFDRQVYEELKRVKQVIFFSLDEYFVYGLKQKQFGQIVQQDFNLIHEGNTLKNQKEIKLQSKDVGKSQQKPYRRKDQQKLTEIANYFIQKMHRLNQMPLQALRTQNFSNWLKN